jgi:hypothetical protein
MGTDSWAQLIRQGCGVRWVGPWVERHLSENRAETAPLHGITLPLGVGWHRVQSEQVLREPSTPAEGAAQGKAWDGTRSGHARRRSSPDAAVVRGTRRRCSRGGLRTAWRRGELRRTLGAVDSSPWRCRYASALLRQAGAAAHGGPVVSTVPERGAVARCCGVPQVVVAVWSHGRGLPLRPRPRSTAGSARGTSLKRSTAFTSVEAISVPVMSGTPCLRRS